MICFLSSFTVAELDFSEVESNVSCYNHHASADGIPVVAVCCQSMYSMQYACNSTEASAPLMLHSCMHWFVITFKHMYSG